MKIKAALRDFDFDIGLRDAFEDRTLSISRRLLAGATMGVDLDTAYYSITEMLEAFTALNADHRSGTKIGEGYVLLEDVLERRCLTGWARAGPAGGDHARDHNRPASRHGVIV